MVARAGKLPSGQGGVELPMAEEATIVAHEERHKPTVVERQDEAERLHVARTYVQNRPPAAAVAASAEGADKVQRKLGASMSLSIPNLGFAIPIGPNREPARSRSTKATGKEGQSEAVKRIMQRGIGGYVADSGENDGDDENEASPDKAKRAPLSDGFLERVQDVGREAMSGVKGKPKAPAIGSLETSEHRGVFNWVEGFADVLTVYSTKKGQLACEG